MIKWILDLSGDRDKVIDDVRAATATLSLSAEAQKLVTKEDHAEFERVQRFVLAELALCTSPRVGVSAKQCTNGPEAGKGDTLSVAIAEYE